MPRLRNDVRRAIDATLELTVIGSFSRIGPTIRRCVFHWAPLGSQRVDGKVMVVSGATSGLGLECATELANLGAHLVLLVRNEDRGAKAREQIIRTSGNENIDLVLADMGDLNSVRSAVATLRRYPSINGLVHNAGLLSKSFEVTKQGLEVTTAVHLVGPFLLTTLLEEELHRSHARVVWVTSGGMYTQPLEVDWLESPQRNYNGTKAYARVKRAQVSLIEQWAPQLLTRSITLTAMHPGWVDTPGVRASLPLFRRVMGPLLRTPAQGVDTIVWLLSTSKEPPLNTLWLDRRARSIHRLRRTKRSDTGEQRQRLLAFCKTRSARGNQNLGGEHS